MTVLGILAAVAMLVAFVLLMGHTGRELGEMRHECSSLISEERRLHGEREQEEILMESAEARRNQVQYEIEKYAKELEDLTSQAEKLEGELHRSRPEGEEEA